MRLKTNLATRHYVNTRAVHLVLGGAVALLALLLLYQVQDAAFRAGEIARFKTATVAAASRTPRGPQVSEAQYADVLARVQGANKVLAQRSVDWLTVLDTLEEVVPPGVALSVLDPDRKTHTLKVSGVARTFSDLRQLLENMEQSRHFSDVYLLTQSQSKVGLTQRGVTFSLTCKVGAL